MVTIQDIDPLEYGDTSLIKIEANFANLNSGKAENSALTSHTSNTSNPHSVTKAQVGLSDVDNTSDTDKPISTATQNKKKKKVNLTDATGTGDMLKAVYDTDNDGIVDEAEVITNQ